MTRARLTRGAIGVAGFLIVGELVIRLWVGRTFDFPAPSAILYEAALLPVDPEFLEGSLVTMGNWGLGLLVARSEEHTSELQSRENLVCRLLLEKKNTRA